MDLDNILDMLDNTNNEPSGQSERTVTEIDYKKKFRTAYDAFMKEVADYEIAMREDKNYFQQEENLRFSSLVRPKKIAETSIAIIGAGALGNSMWEAVTCLGFTQVSIFDDDTVDPVNIGSQRHKKIHLGMTKVRAVSDSALMYRGIPISAYQMRVQSMTDIVYALGYVPDVVIGCTDNTEFRNSLIHEFDKYIKDWEPIDPDKNLKKFPLPKLFLDFRMSGSDWICFAIPLRSIAYNKDSSEVVLGFANYLNEAVFPPEEALQQHCTERGIGFGPMNSASFAGFYLRWWTNDGEEILSRTTYDENGNCLKTYFRPKDTTTMPVSYKTNFSVLDWMPITPTRVERCLRSDLYNARDENYYLLDCICKTISDTIGLDFASVELEKSVYKVLDKGLPKESNGVFLNGGVLLKIPMNNTEGSPGHKFALVLNKDTLEIKFYESYQFTLALGSLVRKTTGMAVSAVNEPLFILYSDKVMCRRLTPQLLSYEHIEKHGLIIRECDDGKLYFVNNKSYIYLNDDSTLSEKLSNYDYKIPVDKALEWAVKNAHRRIKRDCYIDEVDLSEYVVKASEKKLSGHSSNLIPLLVGQALIGQQFYLNSNGTGLAKIIGVAENTATVIEDETQDIFTIHGPEIGYCITDDSMADEDDTAGTIDTCDTEDEEVGTE